MEPWHEDSGWKQKDLSSNPGSKTKEKRDEKVCKIGNDGD